MSTDSNSETVQELSSIPAKRRASGGRVYVGDLPVNATRTDVETIFSAFGKVKNTWLARNPPGFAFVEFGAEQDAKNAVDALKGTTIAGARIRVELAVPEERNVHFEPLNEQPSRGRAISDSSTFPSLRRAKSADSGHVKSKAHFRSWTNAVNFDEGQFDYDIGSSFQRLDAADQHLIQRRVEKQMLDMQTARGEDASLVTDNNEQKHIFSFLEALPFITEGVETVVEDEFTKCFESRPPNPWNWNLYLFPCWCLGVAFRYLIAFPLRLFVFLVGNLSLLIAFVCVKRFVKEADVRAEYERTIIRWICSVFVISWSGVVRYHGVLPLRQPNQIFVANHTSMIDMIVLQQMNTFSLVGQQHPGWVGFMQNKVLNCLGCIWFNRSESKDRAAVARGIQEHIQNSTNNPLLIFPEGTCVNNEYCVLFRKGAFEMGAEVCPIAIKYNKIFVDAFWNSRKQSFAQHLLRLMTCWALVCDVWYLEPQRPKEGESPEKFATRIRDMIAKKAGLKVVDFDGYMKYFKPSPKFVQKRQAAYAKQLLARLNIVCESPMKEDKPALRNRTASGLTPSVE
eukprot:GILJ01008760.1.p1 GENE.GILJ01008760.1~~GILJ01008760.1.p1  ORF type:complete len:568 (-),score=77.82 GILJ01008760.1:168-1871(-)